MHKTNVAQTLNLGIFTGNSSFFAVLMYLDRVLLGGDPLPCAFFDEKISYHLQMKNRNRLRKKIYYLQCDKLRKIMQFITMKKKNENL